MFKRKTLERVFLLVFTFFLAVVYDFFIKSFFVLGGLTANQNFYSFAGILSKLQPFFILTWIIYFLFCAYIERRVLIDFVLHKE